jgi:hypothetical protein
MLAGLCFRGGEVVVIEAKIQQAVRIILDACLRVVVFRFGRGSGTSTRRRERRRNRGDVRGKVVRFLRARPMFAAAYAIILS